MCADGSESPPMCGGHLERYSGIRGSRSVLPRSRRLGSSESWLSRSRWGCSHEHLQRSTLIDLRAHVLRGDEGHVRQGGGPSEGQTTVPGGDHLAPSGRWRSWLSRRFGSSGYCGGEPVLVPHASRGSRKLLAQSRAVGEARRVSLRLRC